MRLDDGRRFAEAMREKGRNDGAITLALMEKGFDPDTAEALVRELGDSYALVPDERVGAGGPSFDDRSGVMGKRIAIAIVGLSLLMAKFAIAMSHWAGHR